MKLCRFGENGAEKPGIVDIRGRIRDLSGAVADITGDALSAERLGELAAMDVEGFPLAPEGTRIGVPVAHVGKIVCAGMNYRDHCEEAGFPIPEQPALFMKPTSSLSGANDPVIMPRNSSQLDWEVELAVVIGKRARHVKVEDALGHVAGYTILNDVSDRDHQFNKGGQWFKGKSADTFCPVGPWIVTVDEANAPQDMAVSLDINGERQQTGHTSKMIFGVAELIAHVSDYMTLEPGDILSTGTPPGVGMGQKPQPRWLTRGDRMTLEIEGLGRQEQVVI